jgi:hypothetical protein
MRGNIMPTYHVDGVAGNDGNDGLSRASAFKTHSAAISAIRVLGASGKNSDIVVWRGYFTEGLYDLNANADDRFDGLHILYVGPSTIDGESSRSYFITHRDDSELKVNGGRFINFTTAVFKEVVGGGTAKDHHFINSAFVAEGSLNNVMEPHDVAATRISFDNCDFFKNSIDLGSNYKNCIHYPDGVYSGSGGTQDYNAGSNATFRGTNGINTGTTAPPFTSVTEGSVDLGFNSGHANYATYRDSGEFSIQIGATWVGAFFYFPQAERMGFTDHPVGAFVNDPNHYDPDWPGITIVSSGGGQNNNIQYNYNATGETTALLTQGTYTDPTTFASMVQAAINVAFPNGATFVWNATTKRFTWTSNDSNPFVVLSNTGSLQSTGAYEEIGFSVAADTSSGNTQTSDYAVTGGWSDEFDIDVATGNNKIDFSTNIDGTVVATVANTTDTPDQVAAAIKTAMEAVSVGTVTVEVGNAKDSSDGMHSKKFNIAITGGGITAFSLLWNTGANKANSIAATIGFDDTADDTGALNYTSDNQVTSGPVTFDGNGEVQIDTAVEPDARLAAVLSPVFDLVDPDDLRVQDVAASESGNSVVDSAETAGANKYSEYRGNDTEFQQTDAKATTTPDWTQVQRGRIPASVNKRYWQRRESLRVRV